MRMLLPLMIVALGFLMAGEVRGDEKKDKAKKPAQGSLKFDGKTYKLQNAVAFESKRGNKKRITVLLSEDAPDLAKLKDSLKKKGNDDDFFFFKPHVKLIFEENGELFQLVIFCDGANINEIGSSNVKGKATVKDGVVTGKGNMVKPDDFFKKEYTFEVEFNVKLTKAE